MLHTVNKSPFDRNSLESCLRLSREGHAILLFEDGIYAALQGTRWETAMTDALKTRKIYVLISDVEARGMRTDNVIAGIQPVDYSGFVDLVAEHKATQAWL
ncbi:MAG: sulfurtransferase complex subunit TusB [Thiotrichaceae bacterium]